MGMKQRGFTIIELMIVVLVIGILTAVAIPQWAHARESSRSKVRLQNCREIDEAKEVWIQENGQDADSEPSQADLAPHYLDPFPTDPGGTYKINPGHIGCQFIPA